MNRILIAAALTLAAFPALAQVGGYVPRDYDARIAPGYGYDDGLTTGSIARSPLPRSSADVQSTDAAADGNAQQLTQPTQNYGNVSGGYLGRD